MNRSGYTVALVGMLLALTLDLSAVTALDAVDDRRVGPLVKSKWDQKYAGGDSGGGDKCYNYHTPGQCYCGCGPTCFAQILRYHEWPKTAVNTNYFVYNFEDGLTKKAKTVESYPCKYQGSVTNLTMIGGVYDWSKMPYETVQGGTPDDEREMIGRLCYDLGVSVCADYNSIVGTGASSPAFVHSLPGNFHYADVAAVEWSLTTNMRTYDQANLLRALLPNLDAGLPCALMIDGSGARHIIVCDGYGYHQGKLHLHLNVGYSGKWDGWYPLEGEWSWKINGLDYTSVAGIVYNISPYHNGPIVSGRIVDAEGRTISGATVSVVRDGVTVTNVVSDVRGGYVYKVPPGDYAVTVQKGALARTVQLTLRPCISTAYLQNGDYYQTPVAVRIANKIDEDILLDASVVTADRPTSIPADGTTFKGRQSVELYTQTEDAEIRYTLDGSIPDRESPLYTEPIVITGSTTVRAIALKNGAYSSEIGTFRFIESTYGELLGTPDTPWISGGFAPWCKDETYDTYNPSLYGLLRSGIPSGSVGKGSATWLEAEIDGPAKVTFDYRYNPYYKSPFVVTTDGTTTNVFEEIYYVSDPTWMNAVIDVADGRHVVRLEYRAGGWGLQYSNGVHLRNMKIVYPNVVTASLGSWGAEQWSWLEFANGSFTQKTWSWLTQNASHIKATVNGRSSNRDLDVDVAAELDELTLTGVTTLVSAGGKLTVGTVRVKGTLTYDADALEVADALVLADSAATVVVRNGTGVVPQAGVSGARVVSEKEGSNTRYSLSMSYVSPFSAMPSGMADWSALTFTDVNNNEAAWNALEADAQARVTLKVDSAATVNVNKSVTLKSLQVAGSGALTLRSTVLGALTVGATAVNADLTVADDSFRIGAVTLADGKTLSVPNPDVLTSIAGGGTLRLTGTLSGVCDLEALAPSSVRLVLMGTLASGGEIPVRRELTVANGASVQGRIVLADLNARVVAEAGAAVTPESAVEFYEVTSVAEGETTVYTLRLAELSYVGPFVAHVAGETVSWSNIEWTDSLQQPGVWADLQADDAAALTIMTDDDIVIRMDGTETAASLTTLGSGHVTLLYEDKTQFPDGLKAALTNEAWTGTVRLAGSGRTFNRIELGDYGNARSTIALANGITGTFAVNGRCEAALVLESSCWLQINSGTAGSVYTFAGKLSGTGELSCCDTVVNDVICFAGDATEFRGNVSAQKGHTIAFGEQACYASSNNMIIVNSEVTIAAGKNWWVDNCLVVNGRLTLDGRVGLSAFKLAPVKLGALSAEVLVNSVDAIVPTCDLPNVTLTTTVDDRGTLYALERNTPPGGDDPEEEDEGDVPEGWYVDVVNGSDDQTGTSPKKAFKTIQKAIEELADGETIYVAPGTNAPISISYHETKRIRIESLEGASKTFIDGGNATGCVEDPTGPQVLTLVGFTLQNGYAQYGGGANGGNLFNCEIRNCTATESGGGAYDAVLQGCLVHDNSAKRGGGLCGGYCGTVANNTYVWNNTASVEGDNAYGTVSGTGLVYANPSGAEPSIKDGEYIGTVEKNDDGEYVVSFRADALPFVFLESVGEKTIVVPPETLCVGGVPKAQLKVRHGTQDLTEAFSFEGDAENGFLLSLDATNSVQVGEERIPVRPELAAVPDDAQIADAPFAVGETGAAVGFKAIPGLIYTLVRGTTLEGVKTGTAVVSERAKGARMKLADPETPLGSAFYIIRVSVLSD